MSLSRTLALSDLHLGRPHSRIRTPADLAPLLEGFGSIFLLGDIVDHWYLPPAQARDLEAAVREVCRHAGVKEVLWFRGNHDANTETAEELALWHGVLYFHGHALYHKLRGTGPAVARIHALNQKKFGPHRVESRRGKPFWQLVEMAYSRVPQQLASPVAWNRLARKRLLALTQEVAPKGGVRAVVFGHTHCPGLRHVGGLPVFNLGGWMRNTRACGFMREGPQAQLVQIENRRGSIRWGEALYETAI